MPNVDLDMLRSAQQMTEAINSKKTQINSSFDVSADMADIAANFGEEILDQYNNEVKEIVDKMPEVETTQEESKEPEQKIPTDPVEKAEFVCKLLKQNHPDAPSAKELVQWRQLHGNVFVLPLDDESVYIYRYLKHQEWRQMQKSEGFQKLTADQVDENIVDRCVLWPRLSPAQKAGMPAGAVSLLAEQIRLQSQFLDPVQVAQITLKL